MTEQRIQKLLIANRGEIACRVMRTCEELRIRTVAVYSEADRDALHTETADEAVNIGPPEARLSYLDGAKIIDAAKRTGADAIHPGYGFLSENADFAQSVIDAGLIWVGPHPRAMREMGSKTNARRIAREHGVPVVPGYDGDDQTPGTLAKEAKAIGFPLMIKASAGGGGKGIRIVHDEKEFASALNLAKQEALAAFGDDRMIVERYVQEPRHVEVQVMGDKHGNLVHLFTRDCSIQRRHQKLIEEAPAPNLPDAVREGLHEAALALARAIEYDNAGTVEFLYDSATEEFYFLEMNTRLQVEHPVTEEITYLDLVDLQLLAAQGDILRTPACEGCFQDVAARTPLTQDMISAKGCAIEARVCAESPARDFQPVTGTIHEIFDEGYDITNLVRVESGVQSRSVVPPYYDSLLAKAIVHRPDRTSAIDRLETLLGEMLFAGIETNAEYLAAVVGSKGFRAEALSTRFLEREFPAWTSPERNVSHFLIRAVIAHVHQVERTLSAVDAEPTPWEALGPWRLLDASVSPVGSRYVFEVEGERYDAVVSGRAGAYRLTVNGREHNVLSEGPSWDREAFRAEIDGVLGEFNAHVDGDDVVVVDYPTGWMRFRVVPRVELYVSEANQSAGSANDLTAPYPGLITEVLVKPGDTVEAGDHLVVMEAMKMLQHLSAQAGGTVKGVYCQTKQTVDAGTLLVEFEKQVDSD